jgi:glycosyltransferase involved in cell wall biosynthesis
MMPVSFFSSNDLPLAVVTTVTHWHEPPRIRHQVARQLARFYNVLYVELSGVAGGATWELITERTVVFRPSGPMTVVRKLSGHLGWVRAWSARRLAREIDQAIAVLGYAQAVLVNFQWDFPELMRSKRFIAKIYVCNDDFQSGLRWWWSRRISLRAEREVIRRADKCLAVSQPLVEKMRRSNDRAELFLPGHEFSSDVRAEFRARERPIRVCYMGFINSRLRVDWLLRLARDAEFELTLIGPVEQPDLFAQLLESESVRHLGPLTGAQLQEQLVAADVLIMPYDTSQEVVRAITAPNKLFQYLACGRPVVSSDLPSLMHLPDGFVYVAAREDEFVQAVRAAFDSDSEGLIAKRLEYSASSSWRARGDRLYEIIRTVTC